MASIFPSNITHFAFKTATRGELKTLALLKYGLPDDYTVFHNVHWADEGETNTRFGEVDFVIVRAGKIIAIEQKNGTRMVETSSGLIIDYFNSSKNVGDQIRQSVENIRDKFKKLNNGIGLNLDYLIYTPDYRVQDVNSPTLDQSRIVHAGSKDTLPQRLIKLLSREKNKNNDEFDTILGFFRHEYHLVPDIHRTLETQDAHFIRTTGGVCEVLQNLKGNPLRLKVSGTAGCGKSIAAVALYTKALEDGKRPLLVCFNRTLADYIGKSVPPGGLVTTFNGLCDKFVTEQGHDLDFSKMSSNPDSWASVHDTVIGEEIPDNWLFDTVIVDEGQDFRQSWHDIVEIFQKEGGDFIWLEDQMQNLSDTEPVSLKNFVTYHEKNNYRSPVRIAQYIKRVLPFEFEIGNVHAGMSVAVHGYKKPDEQPEIVSRIIDRLVKRGFRLSEIVVISCRGIGSSSLAGVDNFGNHSVRKFTGDYNEDGEQVYQEGDVFYDSIYRFKGQEAPAVILCDVSPDEDKRERWEKILFCGMTRPSLRLEILADKSSPWYKTLHKYSSHGLEDSHG